MSLDSTWVTTALSNIQDIQLPMNTGVLNSAINKENPLFARIQNLSKTTTFVGSGAEFRIETDAGYNATPRLPGGDVVQARQQDYDKGHVHLWELDASQGISVEEREESASPYLAANLVKRKNDALGESMRRYLNLAFAGDGTGRLAKLSARDSAYNYSCANTVYNFGWANTQQMRVGDVIDIYTVAGVTAGGSGTDAWTVKVKGGIVTHVTYADDEGTGTFRIAATNILGAASETATPAGNDYVFIHGSADIGADTYFNDWTIGMGVMGICDNTDGSWAAAGDGAWTGQTTAGKFEGLDRTSYPTLMAGVYSYFSSTSLGPWELGDLDEVIITQEMLGTGGENKVTALLMHPIMWNCFRQKAIAMSNPFQQVTNGKFVPGINIVSYNSGGRTFDLIPMFSMPRGTIIGLAEADLGLIEAVPVHFEGPNGETNWFASPGQRNRTFELWSRWKGNLIAKRCDNCFKMVGLSETP